MNVSPINNNNYNKPSFGELIISKQALENLIRKEPNKKKALVLIKKLKSKLADTKYWDLIISESHSMSPGINTAKFTNKTNPKEPFYNNIKIAPIPSPPKSVHIFSVNDSIMIRQPYFMQTLRYSTHKDAIKARHSIGYLSFDANPDSVKGLECLVAQAKILEEAYEQMSKKTATLLQKLELFLIKKNEHSIFRRIAEDTSNKPNTIN